MLVPIFGQTYVSFEREGSTSSDVLDEPSYGLNTPGREFARRGILPGRYRNAHEAINGHVDYDHDQVDLDDKTLGPIQELSREPPELSPVKWPEPSPYISHILGPISDLLLDHLIPTTPTRPRKRRRIDTATEMSNKAPPPAKRRAKSKRKSIGQELAREQRSERSPMLNKVDFEGRKKGCRALKEANKVSSPGNNEDRKEKEEDLSGSEIKAPVDWRGFDLDGLNVMGNGADGDTQNERPERPEDFADAIPANIPSGCEAIMQNGRCVVTGKRVRPGQKPGHSFSLSDASGKLYLHYCWGCQYRNPALGALDKHSLATHYEALARTMFQCKPAGCLCSADRETTFTSDRSLQRHLKRYSQP